MLQLRLRWGRAICGEGIILIAMAPMRISFAGGKILGGNIH